MGRYSSGVAAESGLHQGTLKAVLQRTVPHLLANLLNGQLVAAVCNLNDVDREHNLDRNIISNHEVQIGNACV
jgi:hypothetical protein